MVIQQPGGSPAKYLKYQAQPNLVQSSPVQNTWYTVLEVIGQAGQIGKWVARIRTADETIEARMTVDGVTKTDAQAAVTDTWYYNVFSTTALTLITTTYLLNQEDPFPFHSIKLEVRKTTANGAGDLESDCTYWLWEEV